MINTSSRNSSSDSYSTKPLWVYVFTGIVLGALSVCLEIVNMESSTNQDIPGFFLLFALFCFAFVTYHYSISFDFSGDGIVKRVCMRPVRRLSWD